MNNNTSEEIAARASNRAVTAFLFVSSERVNMDEGILDQCGFRIPSDAQSSDPSRIIFPLQLVDEVKNASELITPDKVNDTLHEMIKRGNQYKNLRSLKSDILADMEESLVHGEDLLRRLNGIPQRFNVFFDVDGPPMVEQIDEKVPFVKLDKNLRTIHKAAAGIGGVLQGAKIVHTSMTEFADDSRRRFGIGFRLTPMQEIERKANNIVEDCTGMKPPLFLN